MKKSPWRRSSRFDPLAVAVADRHYNRQKPGSPQFVPPGRCLVMYASDRKGREAVWTTSFPYAEYVRHAWGGALVNSLFRNETGWLSSDLIGLAVAHTLTEWAPPELGIVSFVDASKIRDGDTPGRCYLEAGWKHVGFTKGGLHAFQQLPEEMPAPKRMRSGQLELFGPGDWVPTLAGAR